MSAFIRCDRCVKPATWLRSTGPMESREAYCVDHGSTTELVGYKPHDPAEGLCFREAGGMLDDWLEVQRALVLKAPGTESPRPMDLDLEHNKAPVCPFCGYVARDAWEIGDGEGETEHDCGNCERPYLVYRHIEVTYSTREP